MNFLNLNFETKETILQGFDLIAEKIAKTVKLKINNSYYRIVDFEFYTYSDVLPDPHTYKNDLQLKNGRLYLHASGVDITFGDERNHGGILLRGVIKLDDNEQESGYMKKQFDGPQNVATELFSNLNTLFSLEKNEIAIVSAVESDKNIDLPITRLVKTKRVGLTPKPTDSEDYYKNLPIRYIAILPKFPAFKQTIKGIEGILGEQVLNGIMKIEEAQEILGYQKKF